VHDYVIAAVAVCTAYCALQIIMFTFSLSLCLSLSVLMASFQLLASFIEAKDDGGGGDNWTTSAISCAKLQPNHYHQQTNIQFLLQAGCPSCRPTNSVKALKGTISHFMDLLTPGSPGDLPTLSLTTNSSWLPWGWLRCLSSAF